MAAGITSDTQTPTRPASHTGGTAVSLYPIKPEGQTRARNVSAATHEINDAVIAWGRKRYPGCRVIREFAMGKRRVDILFVTERDIVGVETKAECDRPDGARDQVMEYRRYLPQVFLAVHQRWAEHKEVRSVMTSRLILYDGAVAKLVWDNAHSEKHRLPDYTVISRIIELLWRDELVAIGQANNAVERPAHKSWTVPKLSNHLAMLLTGREIMLGACAQLRRRPLHMVGMGSDGPC